MLGGFKKLRLRIQFYRNADSEQAEAKTKEGNYGMNSNHNSDAHISASGEILSIEPSNSNIEPQFTELVDCLENLVRVYRSLLDVVRREKEILVASKLDELTENNKSKDAMLVRIRSLENQRQRCALELATSVGASTDHPRLLDIATYCQKDWSDRLRNLHSVLDLLVRRVAEVNKTNEELVQAALNNITGAMEAIRDGLKPKPVYGRQGSMADQKSENPHLVSREA